MAFIAVSSRLYYYFNGLLLNVKSYKNKQPPVLMGEQY